MAMFLRWWYNHVMFRQPIHIDPGQNCFFVFLVFFSITMGCVAHFFNYGLSVIFVGLHLKPGIYFSRRLSAAVAYSFVARAGDHGRHRQLSFKCARTVRKYKQSPDRTTK